MNTFRRKALSAAVLVGLAFAANAQQTDPPKSVVPPDMGAAICEVGQTMTWTIYCDPGTRPGLDRIWNPSGAGTEICRAQLVGCRPIPVFNERARHGFMVQDSVGAGQLTIVTFGLDRLIGTRQP